MQIESIALSDIKPYEKNAKTHPKKQVELLAENIKRFGFTTPCLVDKDNNLIAGHGRLEAEKTGRICYGIELSEKYCDVIVQRYVDYVDNPVVYCNGEDVTTLWQKTPKKAPTT